jgi:hypothetical protein
MMLHGWITAKVSLLDHAVYNAGACMEAVPRDWTPSASPADARSSARGVVIIFALFAGQALLSECAFADPIINSSTSGREVRLDLARIRSSETDTCNETFLSTII